ncbi:MAG TPA: response regulator [Ideonella sp.]|nr:response regulator [Ideonella sp.]
MAKDPYKYFRVEARELLQQLGQGVLDLEKGAGELVPRLLRLAHTMKGAARVVRQPEIADSAHRIEDALAPWRDGGAAVPRESIDQVLAQLDQVAARVDALGPAADAPGPASPGTRPEDAPRGPHAGTAETEALRLGVAQAYAQVARLRRSGESAAAVRALAQQLQGQLARRRGRDGERSGNGTAAHQALALTEELQLAAGRLVRDLAASTEQIDRELRQLRDAAEQLRLVPAEALLTTLERSARDVAQTLGKHVVFEGRGAGVRLDAQVLSAVQGALLQGVRNAVAHGIEAPADRRAAHKPVEGRVTLEVLRQGRKVAFRCTDDGAGIDLEAVRRSAQRKGLLDASAPAPGTEALLQLLLRGGLSTSGTVTEVAGRGVGLDVARETAERLGGELSARTEAGRGTTLELLVPLSLASLDALLVEAGGQVAAVPLDAVQCTLRLASQDIARTAQGDTLTHAGQTIPYVELTRLLGGPLPASPRRHVSALIVEHAGARAALGVDRLQTIATVVLGAMPELAPASALVAGVSLDAEGRPRLVLDGQALVLAAQRAGAPARPAAAQAVPVLVIDDSLTTRMLEQSILESAGYLVHAVVSGEAALEQARRQRYALFLVDVEMPGMDGFTFIERTRADPALRGVPAMLVTSRASPADRQRGLDVGARAYIVKSEFAQAEFLERVRQLVQAP